MPEYVIPQNLVDLCKEGRLIPFIGSGFSAAYGAPLWQELLSDLGAEVNDGLEFEEVLEFAGGDFLRIAEYYYLKTGKYIGPLRFAISRKLDSIQINPLSSGLHVDLVNLGAGRIYTTNFDDFLERVYSALGVEHQVIALPRDVASSAGDATQIVKFHGDLRYDDTLVLTESSYYSRLDFESPMDLKFRADLLGKAVLFMGYSFTDLNIRVIWFKLNNMMKGVSQDEMPTSYIVTFNSNPVSEALYQAVGISPIVLDPNGIANTTEEKSALMSEFLFDLCGLSCSPCIPGTKLNPFISYSAIRKAEEALDSYDKATAGDQRHSTTSEMRLLNNRLRYISSGRVILGTQDRLENIFKRIVDMSGWTWYDPLANALSSAVQVHRASPKSVGANSLIILGLTARLPRGELNIESLNWVEIWKTKVDSSFVERMSNLAIAELRSHDNERFDSDLFYVVDILKRIDSGRLGNHNAKTKSTVSNTLEKVAERYPYFSSYSPDENEMPDLDSIEEEVRASSPA